MGWRIRFGRKKVDKELIERAKRLRDEGLSYTEIGAVIGRHKTTVLRCLNPQSLKQHLEQRRNRWATDAKHRESQRTKNRNRGQYKRRHDIQYRVNRSLANSIRHAKKLGYLPCLTPANVIVSLFTGECHICGAVEKGLPCLLAVDHDHITGKFRGWLCGDCNKALGFYEKIKDSADKYLSEKQQ